MRIAFQGEPGAFSEAAAIQLLGPEITTVPRATFDAVFRAIPENAADALLVPVENSLAGSVVRVYDLMLENQLTITAETILPIELNLIAVPGASLDQIKSVSSHPMALAQCEAAYVETTSGLIESAPQRLTEAKQIIAQLRTPSVILQVRCRRADAELALRTGRRCFSICCATCWLSTLRASTMDRWGARRLTGRTPISET